MDEERTTEPGHETDLFGSVTEQLDRLKPNVCRTGLNVLRGRARPPWATPFKDVRDSSPRSPMRTVMPPRVGSPARTPPLVSTPPRPQQVEELRSPTEPEVPTPIRNPTKKKETWPKALTKGQRSSVIIARIAKPCPNCGKRCETWEKYDEHRFSCPTPKRAICPMCWYIFDHQDDVRRHVAIVHRLLFSRFRAIPKTYAELVTVSMTITQRVIQPRDRIIRERWLLDHADGVRAERLGRGCANLRGRHAWIEQPPFTDRMLQLRKARDNELDHLERQRLAALPKTEPGQFAPATEKPPCRSTTATQGIQAVVARRTTATEMTPSEPCRRVERFTQTELVSKDGDVQQTNEKSTQTEIVTRDMEVQTKVIFLRRPRGRGRAALSDKCRAPRPGSLASVNTFEWPKINSRDTVAVFTATEPEVSSEPGTPPPPLEPVSEDEGDYFSAEEETDAEERAP